MRRTAALVSLICMMGTLALAQFADPFSVSAKLAPAANQGTELRVLFQVPPHHYLYADKLSIEPEGSFELRETSRGTPTEKYDNTFETNVMVYPENAEFRFLVDPPDARPLSLAIRYQGCNDSLCFAPVRRTLTLTNGLPQSAAAPAHSPADLRQAPPLPTDPRAKGAALPADFVVSGRQSGYLLPKEFVSFLHQSLGAGAPAQDGLERLFHRKGLWAVLAVLLIMLGGLNLNLTPCVLPMIPINIAIIGAGSAAGSRRRGFALGTAYGLAMAAVYGGLGLVVVLTGARFGALNASPWFNAVIAGVFVILSLAMFDLFAIDLSRWQPVQTGKTSGRGSFAAAFFMGAVSALLAGACVAPVVVSVLLLSAGLYQGGTTLGLALPFFLGLGMGLPWPFMGAGLSLLPKPGRWMEHVKHVFGVAILGFALYYGIHAYRLFAWNSGDAHQKPDAGAPGPDAQDWFTSLDAGIEQSRRLQKPVLIDFWATWCKNCHAMEKTFQDPSVQEALRPFVKIKFQAERMNDPDTLAVLDQFQVPGLPTYVVLRPIKPGTSQTPTGPARKAVQDAQP